MCNLYTMMSNQEAMRNIVDDFDDMTGNLQQYPGIYPDTPAPVLRNVDGRLVLSLPRWGLPKSDDVMEKLVMERAKKLEAKGKPADLDMLRQKEPNRGTTNIRQTHFKHWQQYLGVENRALVPFTGFAEPQKIPGNDVGGPPVWFALDETQPLAFFAGAWTNWTGIRKMKEGVITTDLYAFLTTKPNAEVFEVHEKAMPVILRTKEEIQIWLTAPWSEAKKLQRPLPDDSLKIIRRGTTADADTA